MHQLSLGQGKYNYSLSSQDYRPEHVPDALHSVPMSSLIAVIGQV